MAVKIRLRRVGAKKRPFYRLVVADARSPRDGRFIEAVGTYDPLQNPALVKVDADRVKEWISKGAKPTDIARQLLVAEGVLEHSGPKFERVEKAPKPSKKQVAKARAAETAAAEPAPAETPVAAAGDESETGPAAVTEATAEGAAEEPAAEPVAEPEAAAPAEPEADQPAEPVAEPPAEAEAEPVAGATAPEAATEAVAEQTAAPVETEAVAEEDAK